MTDNFWPCQSKWQRAKKSDTDTVPLETQVNLSLKTIFVHKETILLIPITFRT